MNTAWRLTAASVLLVTSLFFAGATARIRVANGDDILIQKAYSSQDHGAPADLFMDWSAGQGRFYFALPPYRIPYAIYRIRDPFLFSASRALLLLLQYGLIGWLVARLTRNEAAGWLYAVVAASALHIPTILYPVLSYPAYSAGSICLLLSLHCHLAGIERPRALWLGGSAAFMLAALVCHEEFIIFVLLFPALSWALEPRPTLRSVAGSSLPVALVCAAYLAAYVAFERQYPTSYDGTSFSPDVAGAAIAWFRQTISAVPGFELIVSRPSPYPTTGPFLKTGHQLAQVLGAVPPVGVALALISALAAEELALLAGRDAKPRGAVIGLFALAAALPNLLPAFTAKYQESAHHRFYPYVYSFSAYCWGLAAALGIGIILAQRRIPKAGGSPMARAIVFGVFFLIFFSAQASNHNTIALLDQWFN